jgi:hypothetical protein
MNKLGASALEKTSAIYKDYTGRQIRRGIAGLFSMIKHQMIFSSKRVCLTSMKQFELHIFYLKCETNVEIQMHINISKKRHIINQFQLTCHLNTNFFRNVIAPT